MRISLTLHAIKGKIVPYNYNYPFAAAIYQLLKLGSEEYADFLHSQGYKYEKKHFKLFTFGLKMRRKSVMTGHYLTNPNVELIVSSPKIDQFIENLVKGTFFTETIRVKQNETEITFKIAGFKVLPQPSFNTITKFKMISPMFLSKSRDDRIRPSYHITVNEEDDAGIALVKNLLSKFRLLYNADYETSGLKLSFDKEYINQNPKAGMLIKIKEGKDDETSLRTIMCPFTLEGDTNLMRVGYECGFGNENSLGLGLAEIIAN